ncbi:hypothetical protein B2J93_4047 [Marssonina coronariae]|uniref:Uncharacterized protein n=1 Tax=Diplocarpon coronariae TaxID=2795749 RepID=A0A218ZBV4_9HELO|nr:hypothetical protein B2J93_4047 [Marssonina coronariae]
MSSGQSSLAATVYPSPRARIPMAARSRVACRGGCHQRATSTSTHTKVYAWDQEIGHDRDRRGGDDNRPAAVPRSRFLTGRVAVLRRDSGMRTIPLQVSPVVLRDLLVVQTPRAERRILEQQPLRPVKTANQEE